MKRYLTKFIIVAIVMMVGLAMLSFQSSEPSRPGYANGKLQPCPESPNCVSSEATDDEHRMEPIAFAGDAQHAKTRLKRVIESNFSRWKLAEESDQHLRYEFRSFIFRFTDDVDFLIDEEASVIRFRSAARVGHSDLGVNRNRMKKIYAAFAAEQ